MCTKVFRSEVVFFDKTKHLFLFFSGYPFAFKVDVLGRERNEDDLVWYREGATSKKGMRGICH